MKFFSFSYSSKKWIKRQILKSWNYLNFDKWQLRSSISLIISWWIVLSGNQVAAKTRATSRWKAWQHSTGRKEQSRSSSNRAREYWKAMAVESNFRFFVQPSPPRLLSSKATVESTDFPNILALFFANLISSLIGIMQYLVCTIVITTFVANSSSRK